MDGSDSITAAEALDGRYAELRASAHTLSTDKLLDVIELTQREIDAASALQAIALAHLSARDEHRQEDGTRVEVHHGLGHQRLDAPELAASRMGVSAHVAENRVTDAIDQLTRTPAVVDAMASGDLDQRRAAIVTEQTEFLSPESAAAVVALVAPRWRGVTAGPLRRMVARAAAQVDPEAVAEQAAEARERRGLLRRVGVDGTDHWRGDFRVEQSRPAWAAVTERGRQLVRQGQAASLAQGRSDAMMELILEHCEVTVVLHATHTADPPANSDPSEDPAPPPTGGAPGDRQSTAAPDGNSGNSATRPEESPRRSEGTRSDTTERIHTRRGAAVEHGPVVEPGLLVKPSALAEAGNLVEVGGLGAPGTTFVPATWLRHQGRTPGSTKRRQRTGTTFTTSTTGTTSGTGSETTASDPPASDLTGSETTAGDPPSSDLTGSETTIGDPPASDLTGSETTAGDSARSDPSCREQPTGDNDALRCHPLTGALVEGAVPASRVARGARFIESARTATINSADDLHLGYRIPVPLRRFVYLRDGGCRFPGCMVAARLCDVDHVTPWPVGPTASPNLIALCRRHHRIKQRDGWSVRLEPDGRVRWRDPSGHHRTTWPVDHLHLVTAAHPNATADPGATFHPSTTAHPSETGTPEHSGDLPTRRPTWWLDDQLPTTFEEALAELLEAEYRTPWGRRLLRERAARVSMAHDDGGTAPTALTLIDLFNPGSQGTELILALQPPPPEPIPF